MNRSILFSILFILSTYNCIVADEDLQRQKMEDIFTDLNLFCGTEFNAELDAGTVKFLSCKEPAPTDIGEFILKGTQVSYKISVTAYSENPINNCIEENIIFEQIESAGYVEPLSDDITIPDYQECLNLLERESQIISCLFNKEYISDFNGLNNSFTFIRIEEVQKL